MTIITTMSTETFALHLQLSRNRLAWRNSHRPNWLADAGRVVGRWAKQHNRLVAFARVEVQVDYLSQTVSLLVSWEAAVYVPTAAEMAMWQPPDRQPIWLLPRRPHYTYKAATS